jgi:hypothetical protein
MIKTISFNDLMMKPSVDRDIEFQKLLEESRKHTIKTSRQMAKKKAKNRKRNKQARKQRKAQ